MRTRNFLQSISMHGLSLRTTTLSGCESFDCVYIIYATLCFVCEIQNEYKPRRSRGLYDGLYFLDKTKSGIYYTYADPV